MAVWNALMHATFGNTTFTRWEPGNPYYQNDWSAIQIGRYIRENGGLETYGGTLSVDDVLEWTLLGDPINHKKKKSRVQATRRRRNMIKECGKRTWEEPATKSDTRKRRSSTMDETVSPKKKRWAKYYERQSNRNERESRISDVVSKMMGLLETHSLSVPLK